MKRKFCICIVSTTSDLNPSIKKALYLKFPYETRNVKAKLITNVIDCFFANYIRNFHFKYNRSVHFKYFTI